MSFWLEHLYCLKTFYEFLNGTSLLFQNILWVPDWNIFIVSKLTFWTVFFTLLIQILNLRNNTHNNEIKLEVYWKSILVYRTATFIPLQILIHLELKENSLTQSLFYDDFYFCISVLRQNYLYGAVSFPWIYTCNCVKVDVW